MLCFLQTLSAASLLPAAPARPSSFSQTKTSVTFSTHSRPPLRMSGPAGAPFFSAPLAAFSPSMSSRGLTQPTPGSAFPLLQLAPSSVDMDW